MIRESVGLINKTRKVVLLGAGLMAKPALQILDQGGFEVTVGKYIVSIG